MNLAEELSLLRIQVKKLDNENRRLKEENEFLANKDRPWKYQKLVEAMGDICSEDTYNDTYGRIRMYQALLLKHP